jgi:hypothetical protein
MSRRQQWAQVGVIWLIGVVIMFIVSAGTTIHSRKISVSDFLTSRRIVESLVVAIAAPTFSIGTLAAYNKARGRW